MNTTTEYPKVHAGGLIWELRHPVATVDHLGLLPLWFNASDDRTAQEQANAGYIQTAGVNYKPFTGFKLVKDGENYALQYGSGDEDGPADPPMVEIARVKLRNETICLFDGEWVAIIQPDETFVVARCD